MIHKRTLLFLQLHTYYGMLKHRLEDGSEKTLLSIPKLKIKKQNYNHAVTLEHPQPRCKESQAFVLAEYNVCFCKTSRSQGRKYSNIAWCWLQVCLVRRTSGGAMNHTLSMLTVFISKLIRELADTVDKWLRFSQDQQLLERLLKVRYQGWYPVEKYCTAEAILAVVEYFRL